MRRELQSYGNWPDEDFSRAAIPMRGKMIGRHLLHALLLALSVPLFLYITAKNISADVATAVVVAKYATFPFGFSSAESRYPFSAGRSLHP